MTSIVWNWVGRITGVNPEFLKEQAKGYLDRFSKSIICECGDLKWQHCQDGHCVRNGCNCPQFKSRRDW